MNQEVVAALFAQIIAHRGASRAERENTLAAFGAARALGADAVELDVRRTADGALVVHHDATVHGSQQPIIAMSSHDLPSYVPTLDEALDACAGLWVNVEIKNDDRDPDFDPTDRLADAVVEALSARGEPDRWLISCFRRQTVDRCRLVAPEIRTAWLSGVIPKQPFEADLAAAGHAAFHPWFGHVDEQLVARCHDAGLAVNVWTCDEPADMQRLAACGVDGICTNVPDIAVATLRL